MKKTLFALLGIVLFGAACTVEKSADPEMDRFIDELMSRMTLEEKIG